MKNVVEVLEGFVLEVNDSTFWVRYADLDGTEEEAEIITDKAVSKEDKIHVMQGMPFIWVFYSNGTYDFKFIVEYWTKEQIKKCFDDAKELLKLFKEAEQAD